MSPTPATRHPLRWPAVLGLYLLAVALGGASAWLTLRTLMFSGGIDAGPWRTSRAVGSPDADLYTRAAVALGALLALNREETMYYAASTDSAGRPLRSRCTYRVSGDAPRARWWSVTAYAEDHFLFPIAEGRYSLNSNTAVLDAQGRFSLVSAPLKPPAGLATAWLPTPGDRGLSFTLRLYNPDPALAAAPSGLVAPRIRRVGDCAR